MTIDEMLKVIQAYKDGKQIEYRGFRFEKEDAEIWVKTQNPNWNFAMYDYRIKPEPISIPATDIEKQIKELLDILFLGNLDRIEIQNENVYLRYGYRCVIIEKDFIKFYGSKHGGTLQLDTNELDTISNLYKLRNHPEFLSIIQDYIKPISIPATERELNVISSYSFFRFNHNIISSCVRGQMAKNIGTEIFNPLTNCWEEWSE